ncbi:MAG: transposase, partial [Firmicutes bacterium]|nr:transposase [Bacillota bacterium]
LPFSFPIIPKRGLTPWERVSDMPRKPRIWYPGAIYHVICRGNRRSDIFRDREDYNVYLGILGERKRECVFKLYTYCLMTNHVHLHIETQETDISQIMTKINMGSGPYYKLFILLDIFLGKVVEYFNDKYDLSGHLFQGRFHSEIIEKDGYNLEVNRYIHLNPVRANMVQDPADYHWSSYNIYLGKHSNGLVDTEKILNYFSQENVQKYKEFIIGA